MKTCVIVGGADCWKSDWDSFIEIIPDDFEFEVAVINDHISSFDLAPISWAFTLHPEKLDKWISARVKPTNAKIVTMNKPGTTVRIKPFKIIQHEESLKASTSAGYAAFNLIHYFGYRRVVLVGCPMDSQKNAFRDEKQWAVYLSYQKAWKSDKAKKLFTYMLRSMSGYTKELYGAPTEEWFKK